MIVGNEEKLDKLTTAYDAFNNQQIFSDENQQRGLPNTELVLRALPYNLRQGLDADGLGEIHRRRRLF